MIDALLAALRAEFDDVSLHATIPNVITAPAIVLKPADPFLENTTNRLIQERWEVLVFVNINSTNQGMDSLRKISLRIRRAVSAAGAMWEGSSGPGLQADGSTNLVVVNDIRFRYDPDTITEV